ncbi:polysaccharide biosynthesis/export family protein [Caenimonas aquaedulcis]|uniref:Polysaccharide export protein n=1 Tax=Caenimonas aquaedulcis TaxID=2793270 RepID=A0A931H5X1_9BURK|nr:polysaccharide biosynthesis/export family protein [Caenimonas aquaedulcis]MBG9389052.1 polysaccharide export protein [Caenimonas aquaedulcis]
MSACLMVIALAFHGLCAAQAMDMRVGVAQPSEAGATPADPGARRAPVPQSMSVPLVSLGKDYRVGPNDLIDIEVLDLDNLKRTVRVNAAGAISMPLIGQVVVAGLSSQEVEQLIADRYREKYLQNPQVSIFIKEFTTERITVEGAVNRPGIFPLTGQITLLRALALAGGFAPIANSSQVMLYRVNDQRVREVAVYDIEKIRAGKNDDPPIRGDDLIVVQRDSTRVMLKDSLFRDIIDSINPFSVLGTR